MRRRPRSPTRPPIQDILWEAGWGSGPAPRLQRTPTAHSSAAGQLRMEYMDRETRLKRLRFRAWHRGTREADLLIGGFFDAHHADWDLSAIGGSRR